MLPRLSARRRPTSSSRAVADKYSWLPAGTKAHYFAGVTDKELGQHGPAETELKAAADSWDRNLANLAKLALAGLYHQTNRDAQAIDLYNAIAAKPSVTVSAGVAQLGPRRPLRCYQASGTWRGFCGPR